MSITVQRNKEHAVRGHEARLRHLLDYSVHRRISLEARSPDLPPDQALLDTILNAIPTQAVILDGAGRILLANKAWRYFAADLLQPRAEDLVGIEYLKCGILDALCRRHALALRVTLRAMLRGHVERFQQVVRTNSDRRYQVSVTRIEADGAIRIVMTHEDVSAAQTAQDTIKSLSKRLLNLQEEERQRIALDLHDSTAQQLTAISLGMMSLRGRSANDADTQQILTDIEHMVEEAQKEIRTFSYLLHPPYLDRDGLKKTLMRFVDGFRRRTGLDASAQIADEIDSLTPDVQRALLRIVQEALANVHRHAAATRVVVKLRTTKTLLLFHVSDDGKGIAGFDTGDVSSSRAFGLGLPGMQRRVTQLGGRMKVLSGSRGTTILGKVPLVQLPA